MQKPPRPTGVTVLGVLEILGGILLLAGGALLLALGAIVGSSSFASQYPNLAGYSTGTLSALFYALGIYGLVFGIIALVVGIGFFSGRGWAWTLAIVFGIIDIVITIVEIVIGFSSPTGIFGVIIQIIIIYYLTRPHVKAYFGKGPPMGAMGMPGQPMGSMPMGGTGYMGTGPATGQMGMTCKNCGASIPAGATRCPSCGASI